MLAGGQQVIDIDARPAVVLGARQFHIIGVQFDRHIEDVADLIDILAMDHDVQHHRIFVFLDDPRHFFFMPETAAAADEVVQFFIAGLKADLDMVQARVLEAFDPLLVHADPGGDQVGVIAQMPGFLDQLFQVPAHQRLAAGKPKLGRAHLARLAHDPHPVLG